MLAYKTVPWSQRVSQFMRLQHLISCAGEGCHYLARLDLHNGVEMHAFDGVANFLGDC